jgi:hypothetical protein
MDGWKYGRMNDHFTDVDVVLYIISHTHTLSLWAPSLVRPLKDWIFTLPGSERRRKKVGKDGTGRPAELTTTHYHSL